MHCQRMLTRLYRVFSTHKRSHYEVLGISKNATADEIKKSFYKIAQQLHPDKNPDDPRAKEKFAQANNAYEVLSDMDKRREYDGNTGFYGQSTRSTRASGFTGTGGTDPFEEFSKDFFKDKGAGYYEGFSTGSSRKVKGQDITKTVEVSFVDAAKGTTLNMKYEKVGVCTTCNGNKCKPGTAPTRCMSCGGSGTSTIRQGAIVMHIPCSKCQGNGLIIKNPCTVCKATGVMKSQATEMVSVPAGSSHGETIKFTEKVLEGYMKGNKSTNGPDGDLYVQLSVKAHPKFRKKGNDIEATEFLTISQAVLGHKATVETLWGNKEVVFPSGCQDGQRLPIKGCGIHKIQPMSMQKGDHIVVTRIKVPKTLSPAQRQLFEQIAKTQQKIDPKAPPPPDKQDQQGVFNRFKSIFK